MAAASLVHPPLVSALNIARQKPRRDQRLETVVDGRARTIRCRAVAPAAARGQHVQDAGNDLPIVVPAWAGLGWAGSWA